MRLHTISVPIQKIKDARVQLWEVETLFLEALSRRSGLRVIQLGDSYQLKRDDKKYLTYLWIHSKLPADIGIDA